MVGEQMRLAKERNKFDVFNEWMANVESSIIAVIATVIPWMTPIAPAVMTYQHATETLEFHPIVALAVAATVEALGFASLYLMVTFILFNKKNRAKYKAAPTWSVGFAFLFYLAIIVVSNVLLDAFKGTEYIQWVVIAVKALFTLMAIPGGIVVVVRAAHHDLIRQAELERNSTSIPTSTSTSTAPSSSTSSSTSTPKKKTGSKRKSGKDVIYDFIQNWKQQHNAIPSFSEIVNGTKLPDSTVSRWRNQWITENPQP
jgi:hypothetical protein